MVIVSLVRSQPQLILLPRSTRPQRLAVNEFRARISSANPRDGVHVHKSILLVDYENVGKVELDAIPSNVHVPFFFGASQRSVPTDFMKAALRLADRFVPIDIEGQGTNALDFHIAYYLGEFLSADAESSCVILSKDKGFDPLVKHLQGRGFKVRRVSSIAEAFPESAQPAVHVVTPRVSKRTTEKAAPALMVE